MIALALALTVAALPQDAVVDRAVYADPVWSVSLPRPADDWVFRPATERGTTTVIFHPRGAALSDQLWGALVVTRWDGPVALDEIADRRVAATWRPTFGRTFTLLARDSLAVAGFPAIHLVMGGTIEGAVVDVEEYLVARDDDLVVLQFRLPRGEPRDTVSEGYLRVVAGLDLRAGRQAVSAPLPDVPRFVVAGGQVAVELPDSLMAVAPGTLTSQAVSGGRRLVRWTRDAPGQPESLVAIGRYRREALRVGRLTVIAWRLPEGQPGTARASDSVVAAVAGGWARYWQAFGPVPRAEVALVESDRPVTTGATGIVFLGRDAGPETLLRELARTWWGGYLPADTAAPAFVAEWLPRWSAWMALGSVADSGAAREAWERVRGLLGEPRLRETLRAFAVLAREGGSPERFLSLLDPQAAAALRPLFP